MCSASPVPATRPPVVGVSAIYALCGFALVARFDSFTDFLLPGVGAVVLLQLPCLAAAGLWSPPVFWLWPTQPFLTLLGGAVAHREEAGEERCVARDRP